MVLNDVLYLVGKYLGDTSLLEEIDGITTSSEGRELITQYRKLLNIVQKRIATEWIVLKTKENIEIKSQKLDFAELNKKYYKLIKVVKDGKFIKFNMLDDGIELENGPCEIWYQYLPSDVLTSTGEVFDFNGKISERLFALGIASEYCMLNGMYDTANYFEEKFINSLNSLRITSLHKTMPKRRWL